MAKASRRQASTPGDGCVGLIGQAVTHDGTNTEASLVWVHLSDTNSPCKLCRQTDLSLNHESFLEPRTRRPSGGIDLLVGRNTREYFQ